MVRFANQRAAAMVGHARVEEVVGRNVTDFVAPEDAETVRDRHVRRVRGEEVPSTYDVRLRTADGRLFWANLNAVLFTWEGRPATLTFMRDISALKAMESRLRQAERPTRVPRVWPARRRTESPGGPRASSRGEGCARRRG